MLQQRTRQPVERLTMFGEEPDGLLVGFLEDPLDLGIDHGRGRFAVRSSDADRIVCRRPAKERTRRWAEHNRAELVAHAPARDHLAGDLRRLLHVVL